MTDDSTQEKHLIAKMGYAIAIGLFLTLIYSTYLSYRDIYFNNDGRFMANGQVLGGDFSCFYIAGRIAGSDLHRLYDWPYGLELRKQFFDDPGGKFGMLVYAYPPFLMAFFEPLSRLPFQTACYLWLAASACISLFSIIMLCRRAGLNFKITLLYVTAAAAYLPFSIDSLAGGQTSCLGLLVFASCVFFLLKNREVAAGLALGLGLYKPPLFVLFSIFLLLEGRYKVILSAFLSSLTVLLFSSLVWGFDVLMAWLAAVSNYTYGGRLISSPLPADQGVGLLAFLSVNLKHHQASAWTLFTTLALSLIFVLKRTPAGSSHRALACRLSTYVCASLVFSIQMVKYDLALHLVPLITVAPLVRDFPAWQRIVFIASVAVLYAQPLFSPFRTGTLFVQPAFPATSFFLLALVILCISSARYGEGGPEINAQGN